MLGKLMAEMLKTTSEGTSKETDSAAAEKVAESAAVMAETSGNEEKSGDQEETTGDGAANVSAVDELNRRVDHAAAGRVKVST